MMKSLFVVVLFAFCIFNGYTYYKTGRIPMRDFGEHLAHDGLKATVSNISADQVVSSAKKMANDVAGENFEAPHPAKIQISKWTDANGVVHYDNQPVKGAKEISINPNANVLSIADAPKIEPEKKSAEDEKREELENAEKIRKGMEARAGM